MNSSAFGISSALVAVLALGACATDEAQVPAGNDALGIASFRTVEVADRTSVIGVDAAGAEVARVDVTHGIFTVSPRFADDFATPQIDGRRLEVNLRGEHLAWETEGYDANLSLPALERPSLATLIEDSHVAEVLAQWQIGFQPSHADAGTLVDGEDPYVIVTGWYTVHNATGTGLTLQTNVSTLGSFLYNGTVNTTPNLCGGPGGIAYQVGRVTNTYNSVSQWAIIQMCPDDWMWLAKKTCPLTGPATGTRTSECGSGSGSCKGCPAVYAEEDPYGGKSVRGMRVRSSGSTLYGDVYVDW